MGEKLVTTAEQNKNEDHDHLRTVESLQPPETLTYTALEAALDSYAPDGETWMAAKDIFYASLDTGENANTALTTALGSIEPSQRESTDEEAEARFDRVIDNAAVEAALDGFAPDGGSWMAAKEVFHAAVEGGVRIDEALVEALKTIDPTTAESSPEEATERFTDVLNLPSVEAVPDPEKKIEEVAKLTAAVEQLLVGKKNGEVILDGPSSASTSQSEDSLLAGTVTITRNIEGEGQPTHYRIDKSDPFGVIYDWREGGTLIKVGITEGFVTQEQIRNGNEPLEVERKVDQLPLPISDDGLEKLEKDVNALMTREANKKKSRMAGIGKIANKFRSTGKHAA